MTELSPAAQAVLDAAINVAESPDAEAIAAAALQAAADQVVPDEPAPTGMRPAGDVYSAREIRRGQRQGTRSQLLAIAAELEANSSPSPPNLKPMTNPRDLIKRLADEFECWIVHAEVEDIERAHKLVDEARAYLAQPEPEGPTDEDAPDFDSIFHKHAGHQTQHFMPLMDIQEFSEASSEVLSRWGLPAAEPEGTITEPRGCPTPGACSCPTAPFAPPELIRALELAEAALADIGDAERESGDDLAWAEARASQDLPRIRAVLARWGRPPQ
jgi:hypothetical protein